MKNRVICVEMLKNFQDYLLESEKSSATVEKYMRDIRCFLKYVKEQNPSSVEQEKKFLINKAMVLAYKIKLEQTYAVSSANSMLAALNTFWRFVGWSDLCVKQFKIQKNAYCSENKELTKEEYDALVRVAQNKKTSVYL